MWYGTLSFPSWSLVIAADREGSRARSRMRMDNFWVGLHRSPDGGDSW